MPVTEPPDKIEDWLGTDVQPLAPRPGTFERIQRQARRRKMHQALVTAAGAVVVIAGVVIVPTVAPGLLADRSTSQPQAGASPSQLRFSHGPAHHSAAPGPASSSAPVPSASTGPSGTGLSPTSSGAAPPANFQPTSITMISQAVGAVIGQAGTAGHCAGPVPADCTSLAGTSTDGRTWYGISAPVTGGPDGSAGVSQLRFLDQYHGWAFGPQLWETSDSGRTWSGPEQTFGLRVTDLETAGSQAFALLATCQGTGASYAAGCSTFSLYSTAEGSSTLQPVRLVTPAGQASVMGTEGQASSASLVLTGGPSGGTGYLLSPSGDILSGSLSGSTWKYAGKAPCSPGAANATGTPSGAQLAAGSTTELLINCAGQGGGGAATGSGGGSQQAKQLYVSSSSGARWHSVGRPPASGQATSLAGASQGQVVLATTTGIDYSPDGTSWQPATITGGAPAGGFRYVGMTNATQGVAVPVDARLGEVYVTSDGGQTWAPSPITG
jgi:hypothetical protein